MIQDKKILAIIPARGGSKGLPRKNILELGGIPLIAWTINAVKQSKYIDRYILSSDNEEICEIAKKYGCEVPFIRPSELATDTSDSVSVVMHAIEQVGLTYDLIVLLQPTSPFRTTAQIDQAIEVFMENKIFSLASVSPLDKSAEWMYRLNVKTNQLENIINAQAPVSRRQDSRPLYYLNGSIYVIDKNHFIAHQQFVNENTYAYVIEKEYALDIDTLLDFNFACFHIGAQQC